MELEEETTETIVVVGWRILILIGTASSRLKKITLTRAVVIVVREVANCCEIVGVIDKEPLQQVVREAGV